MQIDAKEREKDGEKLKETIKIESKD